MYPSPHPRIAVGAASQTPNQAEDFALPVIVERQQEAR
jgi:hypothetical protein